MKIRNTIISFIFFIGVFATLGWSWPFTWLFQPRSNPEQFGSKAWVEKQISIIQSQSSNIDQSVLRLSLKAFINANKYNHHHIKPVLTIVDYTKPSTEKRLWVFDLKNGKTLFNTWVSHAKNSGSILATSFSNDRGSLKSSIGVFVTDETYVGHHGYSLRLRGLERGINDNAYRRSIVVHGASYVNPDTIKRYGQIGRSWGCLAVGSDLVTPIINTIKNDTVVVAYYPDRTWLSRSHFLNDIKEI